MGNTASKLIREISIGSFDDVLLKLYVDEKRLKTERSRYIVALEKFKNMYGDLEVEVYSAPGRSEVCGNHTDHQLGKVLATSVNIDTIAVVSKADDNRITLTSEGYNAISISLDELNPVEDEKGTSSALIRGVAAGLKDRGYTVAGFKGYCMTEVLSGSGLSSSAAYEVLIGNILSGLYNEGKVNAIELAQISQNAENTYFGKPCGLMDQMACSVGGLIQIDFENPENPIVKQVNIDFEKYGYTLCIVDTKGSHADLTDEYAAVPSEMKKVAAIFGKEVLRQVGYDEFYRKIPSIRRETGDRAVLRAIHWFDEMERVEAQVKALEDENFADFLQLISASGESSYQFLQNVYASRKPANQEVALGIAVSKKALKGNGAVRVHGGGFAGTIQVFVPDTMLDEYKREIEFLFGEGSCYCLKIRNVGGTKVL